MTANRIPVFVVEDQADCRAAFEELLVPFESLEIVGSYALAEDALKEIVQKAPQLIFLDVELPRKSGFDFLEDLRQLNLSPCIIFTTAYDQYAIQAIKHAAFDYLLKPIDPDELSLSINRFLSSSKQGSLEEKIDRLLEHVNPNSKIRFNTRQGFTLISPGEIIFCKADWNYTEIYLGQEKKELITLNIGKVEVMFPPDQFLRINRSILINQQFIEKLDRKNRIITLKARDEMFEFKVSGTALKVLKNISFGG